MAKDQIDDFVKVGIAKLSQTDPDGKPGVLVLQPRILACRNRSR